MEHFKKVHINIAIEISGVPAFFQMLATGFHIKVRSGSSVRELLCSQIGLSEDYVEKRIQTVFLNGKAVDDIKTAIVPYGATLALSAAMPGLVGATFRRGGHYAVMRSQISHQEDKAFSKKEDEGFTLKLFNLVAKEIGPELLRQGLWVTGKKFQETILQQPDSFFDAISEIRMNGSVIDKKNLFKTGWADKNVYLKLTNS